MHDPTLARLLAVAVIALGLAALLVAEMGARLRRSHRYVAELHEQIARMQEQRRAPVSTSPRVLRVVRRGEGVVSFYPDLPPQ